jgi:hypothetical protein
METKKLIEVVTHNGAYADRVSTLVKEVVSSYYDMPMTAFQTRSRLRQVIRMKQTCVYFIKKFLPKATLSYIGQQTNYDHCTVIYSIKQVENLYEFNKETKRDIDALKQVIEIEQDRLRLDGNLKDEYYYINLNDCFSAKFFNGKGLVLEGFDEKEAQDFIGKINLLYEEELKLREHKRTGVFILEKINN